MFRGGEGGGEGEREIIRKFPILMVSSGHSVLDLTIYGRHLAALEEKTLIRFFNDFKIVLTVRLNIFAYSK